MRSGDLMDSTTGSGRKAESEADAGGGELYMG